MSKLLRAFDEFWFQQAPAERLAMLRILIGGYAFWLVAEHISLWSNVGYTNPGLFKPVGVVSLLSRPLPPAVDQALIIATLVLGLFFVLGWQFAYVGPAFAALLLWVISYRLSWSMLYHSMHLPVLHILVLGLSPAADALSLDARRRCAVETGRKPASSWRYGFPIQVICGVTVFAYFVTGVAKVAGPVGWSWATGETIRSQVAVDAIRKDVLGSSGSSLFYRVYNQLWLFAGMGIMTYFVELGAPLALFNKKLGRVWAVAAFMMHWGILFIMAIDFRYHLSGILYASFFDLERIPAWIRGLKAKLAARLAPVRVGEA